MVAGTVGESCTEAATARPLVLIPTTTGTGAVVRWCSRPSSVR